jgi:hypothetical protein
LQEKSEERLSGRWRLRAGDEREELGGALVAVAKDAGNLGTHEEALGKVAERGERELVVDMVVDGSSGEAVLGSGWEAEGARGS